MSQENVEIVRRAFESDPGSGTIRDLAKEFWHPEIEYVEDPRWPGASSYRGRDAALECWLGYAEMLGDAEAFTITVERVCDGGDRHVAFVRFSSRGSASGIPHEHLWGYVVEVRDGRIAYLRAYYEPAEALEAVGLSG